MRRIKEEILKKKIDGCTNQYKILDYYIYSRVAKIITRPVLKTNLTPNHITVFSIFLGIIAGIFFLLGDYYYLILGAIFVQFIEIFDTVDGAVARFKKLATGFGSFFDFSVNMITGYIAISTIAVGLFFKTSDPKVLVFGVFAVGNFLMLHLVRVAFRWKVPSIKERNEYQISKKLCVGGSDTFTFLILIGGLFNQMYFFLLVLATAGGLVWIKRMFTYYKSFKKVSSTKS